MQGSCETLDPRIRRTRQLLQRALESLLETKDFDAISVQDITEAATVNRATFYAHYNDKFALLECMIGVRFHELVAERQVQFDGVCGAALRAVILTVCDYVVKLQGPGAGRQIQPHMESAIIAVVRRILLEGLKQRADVSVPRPELVASALSWSIYGAVKEWAQTPDRCDAETIAGEIQTLLAPVFHSLGAGHEAEASAAAAHPAHHSAKG